MTPEQEHILNSKLFTRERYIFPKDGITALAQESAESIFEHLEACKVLPPEFAGNYHMQAALITGLAKRIEGIFGR